MAPRETENNGYAKFWSDQQRVLWYVMVFSGVVNCYPTANSRWLENRLRAVSYFSFESQCIILHFGSPRVALSRKTVRHQARGKLQVPIALTLFQLASKHFYQCSIGVTFYLAVRLWMRRSRSRFLNVQELAHFWHNFGLEVSPLRSAYFPWYPKTEQPLAV